MKNGILNMAVFEVLDEVKRRVRISDTLWAKESGLGHQPRIYELRQKAKLAKEGKRFEADSVGRAFSVTKCKHLIDALKRIAGADLVKKEIMDLIDKVESDQERNILVLLTLSEKKQKQLSKIIMAFAEEEED